MTIDAVVAHYKEDLGWLQHLGDARVFLYHKGSSDDPPCDVWIDMDLYNRGREAGTYLRHICTRYDKLGDVTAFLQGDAPNHIVPKYLAEGFKWLPLAVGADSGFLDLSRYQTADGPDGRPNHHHHLPVGEIYFRAFGRHGPPRYHFGPGACFAVSREAIQSKPTEWWRELYDMCESDYPALYPWALERLWPRLFLDELA